jgi:hypothetical protein
MPQLLPTSSSSDMVDIFNLALIPIVGFAQEPLTDTYANALGKR